MAKILLVFNMEIKSKQNCIFADISAWIYRFAI